MQSNFHSSETRIADLLANVSTPSHSFDVFPESALNKSSLSLRESIRSRFVFGRSDARKYAFSASFLLIFEAAKHKSRCIRFV